MNYQTTQKHTALTFAGRFAFLLAIVVATIVAYSNAAGTISLAHAEATTTTQTEFQISVQTQTDSQSQSQSETQTSCSGSGVSNCDGSHQAPPSTIVATKVVCDSEADLPNWGLGGPDITATTAIDWVSTHEGCHLTPGWSFEWGYGGQVDNPGDDFYGVAGGNWHLFGTTGSDSVATTSVQVVVNNSVVSKIWVREVLQDGFIPFTYNNSSNDNDVSAEIYCHNDVLNYDNYDFIAPLDDGVTYYCVAFNAAISPENQKPVITLIGNNPLLLTQGDVFTDPGATAADPEDGDITANIVVGGDTIDTSVVGTSTITYNVQDSEGLAADEVTRTVNVETEPVTNHGVITVCKMIASDSGIATSSLGLPAGTFDISIGTTTTIASSTLYTTTFDTSTFVPNRPLIGQGDDAECVTYNDLPLGDYYYSTESVSGSDTWGEPKYNDQNTIPVNSLSNFFVYSPELFNTDPTDDAARDTNADGHVVLNEVRTARTIVLLNTFTTPTAPQCSDQADNDGDQLVDSADPGCHTDGNPDNPGSYDPNDDSENQKPVITLLGNATTTILINTDYIDSGATAADPEDGDITANIVTVGTSTVATTTLGTYYVTYDVTDSQGLAADQVVRTVVVAEEPTTPQCSDQIDNDGDQLIDAADPGCHTDGNPDNPGSYDPNDDSENEQPVITLIGNSTINLTTGDSFTDPGATAADPEDGDITSDIVTSGDTVNANAAGTYVIAYDVQDSQGLAADQVLRTVIVTDPTVVCTNCGGGGGGGGGGGPIGLDVYNETVRSSIPGLAVVTWNTNMPATSRVAYDVLSHNTPGTDSNYGYANTTVTLDALTTSHSMVITGLLANSTYYFRPISTAGTLSDIGNELTLLPVVAPPQSCNYLRDYLQIGADNDPNEVHKLQVFLRDYENIDVAVTDVFDQQTFDAVETFQNRYFNDILAPWGHTAPTGYVYYTTRKKVNEIYCETAFPLTASQVEEIDAFKTQFGALQQQGVPAGVIETIGGTVGFNDTTTEPQSAVAGTEQGSGSGVALGTENGVTGQEAQVIPTSPVDESALAAETTQGATTTPTENQIAVNNLANLFAGVFVIPQGFSNIYDCLIDLILILLAIAVIWVILKENILYRKKTPTTKIVDRDRLIFFAAGTLIASALALYYKLTCAVLPLFIIFVVLTVMLFFQKRGEAEEVSVSKEKKNK